MNTAPPNQAAPQSYRRAPQEPQTLTHEARAWLLGLPSEVRPLHLARAYARIVNRLTTLWKRPSGADHYLHSLVNDTRGGRRGFPQPIPQELRRLQAYFETEVAPNILPAERPSIHVGISAWRQEGSMAQQTRSRPENTADHGPARNEQDLNEWIANWLGR